MQLRGKVCTEQSLHSRNGTIVPCFPALRSSSPAERHPLSLPGRSVLSFMLLNRIIPGTSVTEATRTRVINEGRAKFEEVES